MGREHEEDRGAPTPIEKKYGQVEPDKAVHPQIRPEPEPPKEGE